NSITRLTEVTYNNYGLLTDNKEYDYGVTMGAAPGNTHLIGETVTTYASLGNGIVGKPATVVIKDWTSGSALILASTTYSYDGTTPTGTPVCPAAGCSPQHIAISGSRGNLTNISAQTNGASTVSKSFTYYDTGTPNIITDVNSAQTTYIYGTTA